MLRRDHLSLFAFPCVHLLVHEPPDDPFCEGLSATAVFVPTGSRSCLYCSLYCLSASQACFCFSLGFQNNDLRSHVSRIRAPQPQLYEGMGRGRKTLSSFYSSSWTQTPSISFVAIAASRRSLILFSHNQLQPAQTHFLPDPGYPILLSPRFCVSLPFCLFPGSQVCDCVLS